MEKGTPNKSSSPANIRRVIRILQIFPFILSLVIILNFILDLFGKSLPVLFFDAFGCCLVLLLFCFVAGHKLHVSKWSESLYVMLIFLYLFDILNEIFQFADAYIVIYQVINILLMLVIVSFFISFIYGKYKQQL